MEKYEQISVIGEGSYGIVMRCKHKETEQIVAIKKFLETEEDATIRQMALREIRMLKRLKHENLVTLIEVFRHRKRFYLVFEYVAGTILDELDKYPQGLDEEKCRERIFQVARAVAYCHTNSVIHRDVKPENVLVSSLGVVKLCDFGFARFVTSPNEVCTEYVATRWYRAPELLVGDTSYSGPVDIWAIGCLFAEIMTGNPLFPGDSDIDQLYLIVKRLGMPCNRHVQFISKNLQLKAAIKIPETPPEGFRKHFPTWSEYAVHFIDSCLKMDPAKRLPAIDLLRHKYFTHDKFPQRFLPVLRSKVNQEMSAPLLRTVKTEIIMSTDKKDESRRGSKQSWAITLTEGSVKRKHSYDTQYNDFSTTGLSRSQRGISKSLQTVESSTALTKTHKPVAAMTSQKSQKSLAKLHNTTDKFLDSVNKDTTTHLLLTDSSPLQFGYGDYNRLTSTTKAHNAAIGDISFGKEPPKCRKMTLTNTFMKTFDDQAAMESIYATGDHIQQQQQQLQHPPLLHRLQQQQLQPTSTRLSGVSVQQRLRQRKREAKVRSEEFTLPSLPGVTRGPDELRKKSLAGMELPHSIEIPPEIRYRRAKRKRITIDISLPVIDNKTNSVF